MLILFRPAAPRARQVSLHGALHFAPKSRSILSTHSWPLSVAFSSAHSGRPGVRVLPSRTRGAQRPHPAAPRLCKAGRWPALFPDRHARHALLARDGGAVLAHMLQSGRHPAAGYLLPHQDQRDPEGVLLCWPRLQRGECFAVDVACTTRFHGPYPAFGGQRCAD